MAFGQQIGPPASRKQVQELLTVIQQAGYVDFRDARGPMGFTQRQAGGKFTGEEVDALLARLQDAEIQDGEAAAPAASLSRNEQAVRRLPSRELASELQRRGWIVVEP